jgi:acetylornithine deacetylase/succinyl-diaminopimelate desuccinylase-like protein
VEAKVPEISAERLWSDIHTTADWGRLPSNEKGITRLALTEHDRCVRNWFCDQAAQLGCEIRVDEMGNIFAILPGESKDVPPIGIGSHLDTQPAGT